MTQNMTTSSWKNTDIDFYNYRSNVTLFLIFPNKLEAYTENYCKAYKPS